MKQKFIPLEQLNIRVEIEEGLPKDTVNWIKGLAFVEIQEALENVQESIRLTINPTDRKKVKLFLSR